MASTTAAEIISETEPQALTDGFHLVIQKRIGGKKHPANEMCKKMAQARSLPSVPQGCGDRHVVSQHGCLRS